MTDHEQARRERIVEAFDEVNDGLAADGLPTFANVDEWICRAGENVVIQALIDFEELAILEEMPEAILDQIPWDHDDFVVDALEVIGMTQEEWHAFALKRVQEKLGRHVN